MRARSRVFLLLLTSVGLALALALVGWLSVDRTERSIPSAPTQASLDERPREESSLEEVPPGSAVASTLDITAPEPKDSREAAQETDPASIGIGRLRPTAMRHASGRLRVRAVDADSGRLLDRLRVRALSATRIADRQSDRGQDGVELALTPDTYTLLLLAPGHEPAEVPPVRVELGSTVALDPVPLRAGSARILGAVVGDLPSDGALQVELSGEGRQPCPGCSTEPDADPWKRAEPCPVCGYAEKASRMPVERTGLFTFDRLVGGPYLLRLLDGQGRTFGLPRPLELRAEESLAVQLESACLRTVIVELTDTDGASLAEEWARRLGVEDGADAIEFDSVEVVTPTVVFECTFRAADAVLLRSSLFAPAKGAFASGIAVGFAGRRLAAGGLHQREVHDRPRGDADALRPEVRPPSVEPSSIASEVGADGLARFEGVLSMALMLEMRSGPFGASVPIPASRGETRVRCRLTRGSGTGTFLEFETGLGR